MSNPQCIRSISPEPNQPEEISDKIDRLSQTLQQVMKEIEIPSNSRNASRLSAVNLEFYPDSVFQTEEDYDEAFIQSNYEETIEKLLQKIDRQQMIIEDLTSQEKIIVIKDRQHPCGHDINKIRKQIWLQVTKQKGELVERERLKFEFELKKLEDDFYSKRQEILLGLEKLKMKEQLLDEKEKQLAMQRSRFEKEKVDWRLEHRLESKKDFIELSSGRNINCRSASFSYSLVRDSDKSENK